MNEHSRAMLEAHVAYEVARVTGPELDRSVQDEVDAVFAWLKGVTLAEIATAEQVRQAVVRLVAEQPLGDAQRAEIAAVAADVHEALRTDGSTVEEVLPKPAFDAVVSLAVGLDDLRDEVMEQLTTSTVYTRLVAHVLYHGIKSFLLTENVVAKRIPGASSLVRLGQRGLDAAAPNLDNQLVSFVNANIKDTIRDSRRYLDALLDEDVMRTVAEDVRQANAGRTVAAAASLVTEQQVQEGTSAGVAVWLAVRGSPTFARVVDAVVTAVFARHGDRPVADVLDDLGITTAFVAREISEAVRPVVDRAAADGFLAARIRTRLEDFYTAYEATVVPRTPKEGT